MGGLKKNNIIIIHFHRCGQETRVIPRILQLRSHWIKSEKESVRLEEAGIGKVNKRTFESFPVSILICSTRRMHCQYTPP